MRLAIVHTVTSLVPVPVVRIDQAMLRRAVTMGQRIGVLATLMSTMALTTDLIGRVASELGRVVEVKGQIVDGAFERARAGDFAGHDDLVRRALQHVIAHSDVVFPAQASMVRAADQLVGQTSQVQVLTSPRPAMEQIAALIGAQNLARDWRLSRQLGERVS